jgi:hypothetical protein
MTRVIACAALILAGMVAPVAAFARTAHPAVTVSGDTVFFYAGHVVLDVRGGAHLDDGVLHVSADRILLDLRANRYVASGNVSASPAFGAGPPVGGAAMGVDLTTHRGLFVALTPAVSRTAVDGANVAAPLDPGSLPAEPLALPDVGNELPFAVAPRAVAHLGADVRLQRARVLVPGGRAVGLPSYVYTFSSDQGYNVTNIADSGEDVPIVFGSTRNSIQGAHFAYDQLVKLSLGLDEHIVDGQRSYVIASLAPLNGPHHIGNFLWVDDVNAHTTQTYAAGAANGAGVGQSYDLSDSVHRSYFDLGAQTFGGSGQSSTRLGWQGYDQQLSSTGLGSILYFHMRSEYGLGFSANTFAPVPFGNKVVLPNRIWHTGLELYTTTSAFTIARGSSVTLSADYKSLHETLPHEQFAATYTASLSRVWNNELSTSISESFEPVHDGYPNRGSGVPPAGLPPAGYRTVFDSQQAAVFYTNPNGFSLRVNVNHDLAGTDNPSGISVEPWTLGADVRFRVSSSLSLDISRSYFIGPEGRRFGSIGIQVFP